MLRRSTPREKPTRLKHAGWKFPKTGRRSTPRWPATWVYVHSSARVESKKKHVSNLQAGKPNYRGASPRERKVRMRGDVAIVNGVSEMHVENAGKEQHFTIRYLAVYAKIADRWQMTAWQSTKVPDA